MALAQQRLASPMKARISKALTKEVHGRSLRKPAEQGLFDIPQALMALRLGVQRLPCE